jgi:hypothetical protein
VHRKQQKNIYMKYASVNNARFILIYNSLNFFILGFSFVLIRTSGFKPNIPLSAPGFFNLKSTLQRTSSDTLSRLEYKKKCFGMIYKKSVKIQKVACGSNVASVSEFSVLDCPFVRSSLVFVLIRVRHIFLQIGVNPGDHEG